MPIVAPRTWFKILSMAAFCLLLCGCGSPFDADVYGTVTLDGQPLSTGAVTFHPVEEGPLAMSQIQQDGSYHLKTGTDTGLKSGEYLVTVVATGPMPEPTADGPELLPELLVPAPYGDPQTSGLRYTIEAGSKEIDLSLTRTE